MHNTDSASMYITEINIEGFKSYAQRVNLTNFDPCFNAITGLNGSGKSNILDSICFVLGIKNLTQVRASNLQELVYKQGQAGVTKATVSITFKNDDPKNGPAGYEDKDTITVTRQIVIGGKNKYMISGKAAQENRVQDLFHSVQLNVNNPHFLIMQGRITKVLNMKPPEILSLLEEASGTRMYEKKKEASLKTLEKKQAKLEEIDQVMNADLLPSLETLRKQFGQYNEWAGLASSRDRLKRICTAHSYCECQRMVQNSKADIQGLEQQAATLLQEREELLQEVRNKEDFIKSLQAEKEVESSGEIKRLQQEADALGLRLSKEGTILKNKKESLASEEKALKQLAAALEELNEEELQGRVVAAEEARSKAREELHAAEHAVEAAARELAGAEAGDGRDESNKTLAERLADAQNGQTEADAQFKAADTAVKHLTKQLAEARKQLASKTRENAGAEQERQQHEAALEQGMARLQGISFDEAQMRALEAQREQLQAEVRRCRERCHELQAQVSVARFDYEAPSPNFDRARVKGIMAKLVRVKDPATAVALEVAAGGKLYNVVVDSNETGKQLLENGRLRKRVTILPLNKIRASEAPANVVAAARQLGGDRASLALQLVCYDEELHSVMSYAFGNAFVCEDAGTAKKLAFSKDVNRRCVTLEGDDFNPSGTLTGGSRSTSSLLLNLHDLMEAEEQLRAHTASLAQLEQQLQGMAAAAKEYSSLKQQVELQQHRLALLKERQAASEGAQLAASVAELEAQHVAQQQGMQAAKQRKEELVKRAKELEREMRDFEKDRGTRIKAATDKQKKAKAALEAAKKQAKTAEAAAAAAAAEKDAAGGEREKLEEKMAGVRAAMAALGQELTQMAADLEVVRGHKDKADKELAKRRARLRECDNEIKAAQKEKEKTAGRAQDIEVELKKNENRKKNSTEDAKKNMDWLARMEKDCPWIEKEKASFGTGDYAFDTMDMRKVQQEYEACEEKLGGMKGKVNTKAQAMLERAEQEFKSLEEKRMIVENDRTRIMEVIDELDEQKKKALEATWRKVDTDFGAIFSTLLPGTNAKLEPPQDATFLEGLEVRVAFGSVWKESLTELSGGQRSLLALSLILALCRFKPAPLYILDEVDAALDLNHTQNIGRMIKQHFPQSQFIVVSLKEGMFNNANVIFRTKFVDGVSGVSRTVNEHREAPDPKHAAAAARNRPALKENVRA